MFPVRARPLPHRPRLLISLLLGCGLVLGALPAQAQQQQSLQPPPGMVTGAQGQSLLLQSAGQNLTQVASPSPSTTIAAPAQAPTTAATAAPTAAPATGSAVSRFLQERGLLGQSMAAPSALLGQVRDTASDLVMSAMNFLGVPYRRGGSSVESGFDCSGFTRHIFELSVGMVLPHRADEQARLSSLVPIKKDDLKPGDLVFFNTMRRTFSHVGIYVGEGKFIHSPRSGAAVRVEDMREAYWNKRFTGARRADLGTDAAAAAAAELRLPTLR